MFNIFKNKNTPIQALINEKGLIATADEISTSICQQLQSKDMALQFCLEEIEAASQGNDESIKFALRSGFSASEYTGAMKNSSPEIDGPGGPQEYILQVTSQLRSNIDLMVKFRTTIVDIIMANFGLGKYSRYDNKNEPLLMSDKEINMENDTNSNILSPSSREYADIRLYSIVAHACRAARDNNLGKIFYYLMNNVGSTYDCEGRQAIDEGEKFVSDYVRMCSETSLLTDETHLKKFNINLLTKIAHEGDFSNIIVYQNKQLEEGRANVTQEGINKLNSHIFDLLDIYKSLASV